MGEAYLKSSEAELGRLGRDLEALGLHSAERIYRARDQNIVHIPVKETDFYAGIMAYQEPITDFVTKDAAITAAEKTDGVTPPEEDSSIFGVLERQFYALEEPLGEDLRYLLGRDNGSIQVMRTFRFKGELRGDVIISSEVEHSNLISEASSYYWWEEGAFNFICIDPEEYETVLTAGIS